MGKPAPLQRYRIRDGHAFIATDDKGQPVRRTGGDVIELPDDVARAHAGKVDRVTESAEAVADKPAAASKKA